MRKLVYTAVGAAALASASIASAAVTVTGSSGLNNPDPAASGSIVVNGGLTTINFGQNPVSTPDFTGSFSFSNDVAGLYTIVLNSSTPGVTFSSASVTGPGGPFDLLPFPDNTSLKIANAALGAGDFMFNFTGNNTNASGTLTGNVTISSAVPEAASWAMMMVGFGAMGIMIRRRRRTALPQLA
jgi:hypothetical protein